MASVWRATKRSPIGWRNESYRHYLAQKGISTKRTSPKLTYSAIIYDISKNTRTGGRMRTKLPDFLRMNRLENVKRPRLVSAYAQRRSGDESVPGKAEVRNVQQGATVTIETRNPKSTLDVEVVAVEPRAGYFVGEVRSSGGRYPFGTNILFKRANIFKIQ